jgi:aquaporin Z
MSLGMFPVTALRPTASLVEAVQLHWREYLMEAAELAALMLCICFAGALFYGGNSPIANLRLTWVVRSSLMGATVAAATFMIMLSPFGRRSGAHINPALTLAYFSVRRIHHWDAISYVLSQFFGAIAGVYVAALLLGRNLSDFPVRYVVTLPGRNGVLFAFVAELMTSFVLMGVVLISSNHRKLARYSPIFVALVTVLYYILSPTIAGYSVNPARSFSSAVFARLWQGIWIYFVAPVLGMVTAASLYTRIVGVGRIYCAKVFHDLYSPCPFDCHFPDLGKPTQR